MTHRGWDTDNNIALIKGLLKRGETGDSITWFMALLTDTDVNHGRVSEIKTNYYQHRDPNTTRSKRYQNIAPAAVNHIPLLREIRELLCGAINNALSGKYPTNYSVPLIEQFRETLRSELSRQDSRTARLVTQLSQDKEQDNTDWKTHVTLLERRLRSLETAIERQKTQEIEAVRMTAEKPWKRPS